MTPIPPRNPRVHRAAWRALATVGPSTFRFRCPRSRRSPRSCTPRRRASRTPCDSRPGDRRLAQAIDGLPDGYRTVFVMHDVEGYTHEEIGATLGIETGTSKAQLSRARAKLRDALADFAGEWVS